VNEDESVRLERREPGVAWIVIDRPNARNAMSKAMWLRFGEHVRALAGDPSVRVLVVTGGPDAFVAGADIAEFNEFRGAADGLAYEDRVEHALREFESLPLVTVAAVSGYCTGGGTILAAACDLRFGSADARVGIPIARTVGNITSAANIARVAAVVGSAKALEWILTARLVDAVAAERAGFFSAVVADREALLERARSSAAAIARNAPLTMLGAKEIARRLRDAALRDVEDRDVMERCYGSEDFREGVRAFFEKRTPQFAGR
jgi:enoyl-CoA hydratase/carnithine racemase